MKKERIKKLELNRETVRRLEDEKLREAAAGGHIDVGQKTDPITTC